MPRSRLSTSVPGNSGQAVRSSPIRLKASAARRTLAVIDRAAFIRMYYLIFSYFSSNILYKVLYYTTSDIEPWPINIKVFFYLAILFVIVYNRNKLAERFPYFNIILNLLFLFVLLRNVLWESVELDMQLGFYMSLGMTMGFPLLFEIVSRKLIRQLTFVVFVFVNWYQCQNYFFSIPEYSFGLIKDIDCSPVQPSDDFVAYRCLPVPQD